jgi:serine/threonine protein kinase
MTRRISHIELNNKKFECVRKLGKGGNGSVELVRDKSSGALYAVKVLHAGYERNDANTLNREKAIATYVWKNIPDKDLKYMIEPVDVTLTDFSCGRRKFTGPVHAMKYYDGYEELYKVVSRRTTSVDDVRRIIIDLRRAVFSLWKLGILHGDLHTGNIMVNMSGTTPKVKIIDLGLSEITDFPVTVKLTNAMLTSAKSSSELRKWWNVAYTNWGKKSGFYNSLTNPNGVIFGLVPIEKYFTNDHSLWTKMIKTLEQKPGNPVLKNRIRDIGTKFPGVRTQRGLAKVSAKRRFDKEMKMIQNKWPATPVRRKAAIERAKRVERMGRVRAAVVKAITRPAPSPPKTKGRRQIVVVLTATQKAREREARKHMTKEELKANDRRKRQRYLAAKKKI